MKKFISLLTLFAILLSVGCSRTSEKDKGKENPGAECTDYLALYAPILDEYYNVILNIDSYDTLIDGKIGIMEIAKYLKEETFNTVGYLLKDINGDEVPELLFGLNNLEGAYVTVSGTYSETRQKPCSSV